MRVVDFAGCCNAYIYADLGGAHGHMTAVNQNAFDARVKKLPKSSVNVCITNSSQGRTRKFLEAQGWETKKVGHLFVHTVNGSDLRKYFHNKEQEQKKIHPPVSRPKIRTGVTLNRIRELNRIAVDRVALVNLITANFGPVKVPATRSNFYLFESIKTQVANRMRKERENASRAPILREV